MTASLYQGKGSPGVDPDLYEGTVANDYLSADAGADTLMGGKGDDTLRGGSAGDLLDGGDGIDTAAGCRFADLALGLGRGDDGVADTLLCIENAAGSAADDELLGSSEANRLDGHDGADRLNGREGDDVLYGGKGDDLLTGGAGNDRIDGETDWFARIGGDDTVVFSGNRGEYVITFDEATVTFTVRDKVAGRDGVDTVRQVEHFRFADGDVTAQQLDADYDDAFEAMFPEMPPAPDPIGIPIWDEGVIEEPIWIDMAMDTLIYAVAVTAAGEPTGSGGSLEPTELLVGTRAWLMLE